MGRYTPHPYKSTNNATFQQMQQKYFSQTLALFETETIPNKLRFHKQKYEENHILYKKWLNLASFTQIFSAMST